MSDQGNSITRSMPFSSDAEKGVLSCFLHNPEELLPDAMSTMKEEWFHHAGNRLLFVEMTGMAQEEKPVEYVALSQRLQDKLGPGGRPLMEAIGGQGALAELLDFIPTPTHYGYYKGILRDKWLLRMTLEHISRSTKDAYTYEATDEVLKFLTEYEAGAFEILQSAQQGDDERERPMPLAKHLEKWFLEKQERWRNRGKMTGITTGLHDLDRMLHGMDDREGEVMVVAARPGQGKTAFMISVLHHVGVVCGIPSLVFSIEMTANQLNDRLVLGSLGIDTAKGHSGMFSRDEWKRLGSDEMGKISAAPIWLDASSEINSADLRVRCQTLKRQHGIRFVAIDYLALVDAVGKDVKSDERLKIVEVMNTVRWIAKKLKCVVMVLAQLNRETDRNRGKPPMMADLAGSASIEAAAHNIVFLHRPESTISWHRMSPEAREDWIKSYASRRQAHPECWGDGRKKDKLTGEEYGVTMGWETGRARQDWEEHAIAFLAKNRRGPTNEIWLRYQNEMTWYGSRTPKLYSGNQEERQINAGEG